MTTTISKWGNSQGLRFPKSILNDKIILEPIKKRRKKYNINELVKQIPSDYKPYEEFYNKSGIEEW